MTLLQAHLDSVDAEANGGLLPAIPAVDFLWQAGSSMDMASAYQIARVIASHLGGEAIRLVVAIDGPGTTATASPKSHTAQKFPNISQTPDQLLKFLNQIDYLVDMMGGNWNRSISLHPDAEQANVRHDWLNQVIPSPDGAGYVIGSAGRDLTKDPLSEADAYGMYVDYYNYLNRYLADNAGKYASPGYQPSRFAFDEFLFEYEASQYDAKDGGVTPMSMNQAFNNPKNGLRSYPGVSWLNPDGASTGLGGGTLLSGTSYSGLNWDSDHGRAGVGMGRYWPQIYDLAGDTSDYSPDWKWIDPQVDSLDPGVYSPSQASQMFVDFMVDPSAANPKLKINNINRLLLPQADANAPATAFDSRVMYALSYFGEKVDSPVFYQFTKDKKTGVVTKNYGWDSASFADFVDIFKPGLSSALESVSGVSGSFSNQSDFNLGVFNSEHALDQWLSVPALQHVKSLLPSNLVNV